MKDVREILKKRPLLFDGGMGTYYKAAPGQECEQANLLDPEGILAVHRAYLAAGADAVKTNTFGLPRMAAAQNPVWEALADEGWKLAVQAAAETGAAVFADIGPAPDTEAQPAAQLYIALADRFAALGTKNFLFETLSTDTGVTEAAQHIKKTVPDAFILVSFAVLPDGYTREGRHCAELVRRMTESGVVDAVGLNCVSAPGAMRTLVQRLDGTKLPLSVMPNAGAVPGQAGIFCPGAGPHRGRMQRRAHSGRLLRHDAGAHRGPAHGIGCFAGSTACRPGGRSFHPCEAGSGKRRRLPAQAERREKGHCH